jgi:7,8-dihydro-6-hydroxymethylpterin-pyrophosphokinase
MAFYFIPIDVRLRIDIFLFNSERRNFALLVVFHDRFNKRAFLILAVADIRTTRLPETL